MWSRNLFNITAENTNHYALFKKKKKKTKTEVVIYWKTCKIWYDLSNIKMERGHTHSLQWKKKRQNKRTTLDKKRIERSGGALLNSFKQKV